VAVYGGLFDNSDPSFSGNAELVDEEEGDDARMACLPRTVVSVVGLRHNDEFANVSFCVVSDQVVT